MQKKHIKIINSNIWKVSKQNFNFKNVESMHTKISNSKRWKAIAKNFQIQNLKNWLF